jgi:2-methylcitrate dehydratase
VIESIEIRTFDVSVEIIGKDPEKWNPQSRETADHSLPYLVAVALADGAVGAAQFTPERIADPALRALIQKVRVVEDPEFSSAYPRAMPNEVVVQLTDGRRDSAKVMIPKGHPQRPLTDAEVEEKFRTLAQPALGAAAAARLLQQLWRMEEVRTMEQVMELCRVPARNP